MVDVALAAQISPETLRKIESGRIATPAFATVASVAAALGLSLDEVWTEITRPASSAASSPGLAVGPRSAARRTG